MTQRKRLIAGTIAAAGVVIFFGGIAARKRGSGVEVSMGPARQPKPQGLGRTTSERITNAAEMPTCSGWKE